MKFKSCVLKNIDSKKQTLSLEIEGNRKELYKVYRYINKRVKNKSSYGLMVLNSRYKIK